MASIHQTVGTLVVVLFVILTVGNIMRATGKAVPWTRPLSNVAGGFLILQYILGFTLLGTDHRITFWHYLFALAAIFTVGMEHGVMKDQTSRGARMSSIATAGTMILTLVAYAIGSSN